MRAQALRSRSTAFGRSTNVEECRSEEREVELQWILLGLVGGAAAGYCAGKLAAAALPLVRDASALPPGVTVLLLLGAVGLLLGYLIQLFFAHWTVLPGALAAYLCIATPILRDTE